MYQYKRKIFFYEVDAAGILFFGNIMNICHESYENFLHDNISEDFFNHAKYVIPIKKAESEYFLPIKMGEDVNVELTVGKIGKSSFEIIYNLRNYKGEIAVTVKTVHVFADKKFFQKTTIPVHFREVLTKYSSTED